MNKVLRFNLIAILVLAVSPCWAGETSKQSLPTVINFAAPNFTLSGEDGKTYRLSDYRGKVVVLNFWATWCPPCRQEMPALERAWKKVKGKGVVFLAVSVGDDEDQIFQFLGEYPVTFPILMDEKGEVVKRYPVIGLPTTYIINPHGQVTHRAVGTREWDHAKLLDQLLAMVAN